MNALKALVMDLTSMRSSVVLNDMDARTLSILLSDRVMVRRGASTLNAIVETSRSLVP